MTDVRAITVKQPWAWAIAHGGKNIENRSRPVSYRGPLLIHAGAAWSERGNHDPRVQAIWGVTPRRAEVAIERAIVALVDLVDVHPDAGCCKPWGESVYARPNGSQVPCWHYVLDDVRALPAPVLATGRLGLWRPAQDLVDAAWVQLEVAW